MTMTTVMKTKATMTIMATVIKISNDYDNDDNAKYKGNDGDNGNNDKDKGSDDDTGDVDDDGNDDLTDRLTGLAVESERDAYRSFSIRRGHTDRISFGQFASTSGRAVGHGYPGGLEEDGT